MDDALRDRRDLQRQNEIRSDDASYLRQEVKRLTTERSTLRERKTDDKITTDTIMRLRAERDALQGILDFVIYTATVSPTKMVHLSTIERICEQEAGE